MTPRLTVYYGPVFNPKSLTHFDTIPNCLIAVSATGNIEWVDQLESSLDSSSIHESVLNKGCKDFDVVLLGAGEFIIPGFIDTHTHAPQYPVLGTGSDMELLTWLTSVTFPGEAKFKDTNFARRAYPDVVRRVLDCGTTTCCYYGSLHLDATKVLADVIHEKGQRAFVGKCNMDKDCATYYIEPSANESMETTKALFEHIKALGPSPSGEELLRPILTPRFALSCSDELLHKLCEYANAHPNLPIQTHISENPKEVEEVYKRFGMAYAEVYDEFDLLRGNTILGHGVHLTLDEVELIVKREAGVSHCPVSNFNLNSGVAKVGEWLDHGVKVGFGTDVSGGYSPSMLNVIQQASIASKVLAIRAKEEESKCHHEHGQDHAHGHSHDHGHHHHHHSHHPAHPNTQFTNKQLSIPTLLYLATLGGAHVCSIQDRVGSFEKGKGFDALVVSVQDDTGNPGLWGINRVRDEGVDSGLTTQANSMEDVLRSWLEQFLFCGDDRNIKRVYVQGSIVGGREFKEK
ncbi:hypothetical protein SERLADRAFT_452178 [Serpula lacrymans var. lacrymans S7.9]|uniref:Amidohydrolase-related domain-containing protein n=1 Tax=Serpula lacrymans var. lacrymans (strain S7.9) TaxID=578457 RepID=F8P6G4_SERL9|nr:uncharacterized protein SERLADRAFT_452178 [Serpula lacrymans var. lacrymans S7.9]EGO21031.1 hypothetical protein SERLADRAFT_452178 [Serpula lacrymans var. lacrymans S7.9]